LLTIEGHEVATATSAEEALSRLERGEAYDVGFCDLMMPNVNGIELYERLGRVAPALAQRVAFVTGGAFTAKAREFLASNSTRVLSKPFELQDVRAMLATLTHD
jgi:CheY-like chemotaxis protein